MVERGGVSGLKTGEDGEALEGALIGLFAPGTEEFTEDTALMTAVSAEDGSFRFDNVPVGNWILREIQQPEGFVLSEEQFPVTVSDDEQIVEITIQNEQIRGNITLTKHDADYPDNKLTGAIFEVYRDSNGNGVLDDEDELIGEMEETSDGVYWMEDLVYDGYFVKEKVTPEGFVLDENTYYVFIDTDGETYEVENEAGKGFLNEAMKGSLKIVKTTDDGKVEGFAFRVQGANGYDMTFTTDENGEIFIENLRIGEYVVTELENEASKGYKIADPVTVTLVLDETLTVNVHNNKITVDIPKTGDDSPLVLWLVLTAIGAVGVTGSAIFYFKKVRGSRKIIDDKALQDEIGYDKYDVVVANIIADVICAISPVVPKQLKKGGVFIASGIIKDRIDDVYKALAEVGLKVIDTSIKDEWVSITSIKE